MIDSQSLMDAEKLVLSQAMDGGQALADLQDLGLSGRMFAHGPHAKIWRALEAVSKAGKAVDALSVVAYLEATGELEACGGQAGVVDVAMYGTLTRFRTRAAVELVTEATKRRELRAFSTFVGECAIDNEKSAEDALECAEREMVRLRDRYGVKQTESIQGAISSIIDDLQWRMTHPGAIRGISSGFRRLDVTLDGLQAGAMIVMAARPGIGKTAALLNILTNICLNGVPVGMFSLEMPTNQLLERMLYGMAGINADDVRRGKNLTTGQTQAFTQAVRRVANAPLHIDDEGLLSIEKIKARARRMVREHGIQCLGIDYIQLIRSGSQQAKANREREVAEISSGLKALAKELKIPVIVLAQLNRDVEKRAGKAQGRPVVSDLRESGSIEQDADQIILLHRPGQYDPQADPMDAQWIIGKNRFGRTGLIPFLWRAEFTRYEEVQHSSNQYKR